MREAPVGGIVGGDGEQSGHLGFLQRYGTQFTQWDAAAIKNRAENLANEGYDKIWNLG